MSTLINSVSKDRSAEKAVQQKRLFCLADDERLNPQLPTYKPLTWISIFPTADSDPEQ